MQQHEATLESIQTRCVQVLDTAFAIVDIRHGPIGGTPIVPDASYSPRPVLQTAFVAGCVNAVPEGLRR